MKWKFFSVLFVIVSAVCLMVGLSACNLFGDSEKHIHTYVSEVTTEPTCTETGIRTYTCSECDDTYTEEIAATGHTYGEPTWSWSSDYSTAIATFTCTSNDDIQELAANITSSTTSATCTVDGKTVYTATVTLNGLTYTDTRTETITAAGHTYDGGYEYNENEHWQICTICGNKSESESHIFIDGVCTKCGYEIGTSVGLAYSISDNGSYYSVKGIGTCTDIDIVIPSKYKNLPVTAITSNAFRGQTQITGITIPDSVTSIGRYAFYNTAFYNDSNNWTDNVLYIGTYLIIADTSISESYEIKNVTTVIANYAFNDCISLENVTIPDSVASIGISAFSGCSSLTSVYYDGTASQWASITFGDGSSNPLYYAGNLYLETTLTTDIILEEITTINAYAFYNCTTLTSVTISDSVTSIGSSAFSDCSSLKSIYYNGTASQWASISFGNSYANPVYCAGNLYLNGTLATDITLDGITDINAYAFYGCTSLESITISDSITSIGSYAFYDCTAAIVWGDKPAITEIGSYAFAYYDGTSITIPVSITSIGEYAFSNCASLTGVYYDGTASQWASISFSNGSTNPLYYAGNLYLNGTLATDITLEGITVINAYAFYGCTSLTSITIDDSMTSIGSYAFYDCTAAIVWGDNPAITEIGSYAFAYYKGTSITIPDSITSIDRYAFYDCTAEIIWSDNPAITEIESYAFAYYDGTSITIPVSITSIGEYAFSNCASLTGVYYDGTASQWASISFGNATANPLYHAGNLYLSGTILTDLKDTGLTTISDYAFAGWNVTSITVLNSVTSIGNSAFSGCSNLVSITLPFVGSSATATSASSSTLFGYIFGTNSYSGGVSTTQYYADNVYTQYDTIKSFATYYLPTTLTTVTITGGKILYGAFYNCTSLTSITLPDNITSVGDYAFAYCTFTSVTIPDSVTTIGSGAFYGCTSLASIIIPDGATSINYETFYNCTSLTNVTIPNSITSVDNYAFAYCTSLENINLPDSITSIGSYAFRDCTSLKSITIPDSVTSIDSGAFEYCTALMNVTISDNITSIATYIFYGCTSLESITIPDGVTSIGYNAFVDCTSLTSVTIGDNVTSIGTYAFRNCTALESITIPDSVTSIGSGAFHGCTALTSVTIGVSVTSISNSAFYNCTSLESVIIPDSVTSIGDSAFYYCTSLTSITIGDNVTSIGDSAFDGCFSLTSVIV